MQMLDLSQQDFLGEACCNLSEVVRTSIILMIANTMNNLFWHFLYYAKLSKYLQILRVKQVHCLIFVLCSFRRL